jgi:hypothetical protein
MSIQFAIHDAHVSPDRGNPGRWLVLHPCNDAILAYCDTREEAEQAVIRLNALCKSYRISKPPLFEVCACGQRFTRAEWDRLVRVGDVEDDTGPIELRNCSACGSTIGVYCKDL